MKIIFSTLFLILTSTILAQVPSYVPTSGLVGWWPFSGNANDLSGNGNNGTVTGATLSVDRFGNANQAYAFNGVNCCGTPDPIQEIFISNQIINLGQNYTVSCWMKSTNVSKYQQLLFLAGSAVELNNEHVPTKLTYAVGPGTSWDLLYAPGTYTGFQNNVWYHVVFVKSGTSYTLYLNTNLEGTSTVSNSASYTQTSDFRIGSLGGGHEVFKGSLDDFAVWNRALTSSEISGLYSAPASNPSTPAPALAVSPSTTTICAGSSTTLSASANAGSSVCVSSELPTGLQSGLVGYWPFCGNANDASGNGNNGTVNGATLTTDRFGSASSAYSFDGNSDVISTAGFSSTNSFTSSVWVKMSNLTGYLDNQTIVVRNNDGLWDIGYDQPTNKLFFGIYNGSWTKVYSPVITANQWVHVVAVFQPNNQIKIYINGVLSQTQNISISALSNLGSELFIGGEDGSPNKTINGSIDDLHHYNYALTATEIQQLYTLGNATYSWSPGGATTSSITVSPTSTTTYTCTATANGVSSSATSVVTVNPAPTVNAGADQTVFAGTQVTLAGSGATTYSWDNGVTNNTPFTATATTTYTVTGTSNGCTATDQVLVTVLPAPTLTATNSTICAGSSTTLTAASASTGTPCASTGLPSSLTTGLVGYWPFCGNANDASGNGNNGTTMNGVALTTDRFGNSNSAYSFDGVDDRIEIAHNVNQLIYGSQSQVTMSFWVQKNNSSIPGDVISKGWHSSINNLGNKYLALSYYANAYNFSLYNNSTLNSVQSSISAVNNQWDHLVIVRDASIKFYINGIEVGINALNAGWNVDYNSFISNSPLTFGARNNLTGGSVAFWSDFWDGKLDDIGIWNRALTATDIQQLYTQGQATYSWSPGGATTPSITVSPTATTTYTCTITNGGATSTVSQTVTVNPAPTVNAGADQTVFAGTQVTLTGSGATTYSWDNGVTNNTPFTATTTTTYTVTGTSNGCTATDQVLVTVLPAPTVTATNSTICSGSSTTLTAASTSTGTPCASTGLSGTLTTGLVGYWPFCGNANDASGNGHNGTVNGATLTTDRFGLANSAYSFGPNFPTYIQLPEISNNLGAANASSTISIWSKSDHLTLYGVMLHASSSNQYIYGRIEENSNSKVKIYHRNPSENDEPTSTETTNVNDWNHYLATIDGSTGTYKFYVNGVEWTSMQFSFNPSNSYYQSNRTWQIGCISSDQSYHQWTGKIDDFGIWNRVLTASEIQQLASQSQVTYAWSPGGATTPSITVSPTATTTYTCLVTQGGATSTLSHTITVNSTPTVSAGADQTVFAGSSVTLAGSGATTYSWNNGVTNNTPFTASATTTYTVTGTSNGCTATDQVLVTVLPAPTVSASSSTICAGQSTTLTATSTGSGTPCASTGLPSSLTTGLVGYWPFCGNANDASGNGSNGTVNGATLTTDRFGNTNSAYNFDGVDDYIDLGSYILNSPQEYTIDLWAKFNNSTFSYLFGQATNGEIQIQLDGSGNIKSWTKLTNGGNVSAGTSIPDYSNWHHVTAIFNNNTKILQFIIDGNVFTSTIPNNVNIQSFNGPALFGRQSNVNANFFNGLLDDIKIYNRALTLSEVQDLYNLSTTTYSWSPGGATTPSITVSPTTTTTYTCTVTNGGATSTVSQTVTVNAVPTVNAGADLAVCNGSTATLTATGAATYSWTNSIQNGVAFTPIATTTYTVTGTDANGCTGTDAVTVTLVPTPTISATNASVCAGQSTTLTASTTSGTVACPSLSGSLTSGLVGYWPFCGNANDVSGNGNNGTVNGATLTTDRFGNTNNAYSFNGSNSIDIGVNGFSTGNSQATLSGWVYITTNPAGVSYIVGYGDPANQGAVFATGVYGSAGLFGTFSGAIYDAISNINCPINSWNLVTTVKEANGTIKIYLNATLIYTQTVATPLLGNVSGRIGRAVWNSSEYWNGKIDDVAVWNRALTAAEIQQLYTTGQATYSWSPGGATTPSITVSPTTTTTYTCTVTDVNGNSCSASQTITVIPFTGVNAGADQSICSGGSVTLNATGATSFSWNNNVQNGVAFSPLSSGTYIVTGTQNGCTATDTVAVTVVADPFISNPVSASYCQNGGTAAALSASASGGLTSAYTYQWYSNTSIANFGGTAIAGATSASYVPSLSSAGTFYYYCTVAQGSATSGCATTSGGASVNIGAQPAISAQPTPSQSGCVGASLSNLAITATGGVGSAAYQWYTNTTASTTGGTAIVGANSASYTPPSATAANTYYYAIVSYPSAATSCAQATSQIANVNIINDPIFTQVPQANQTVCIGGTTPALTISTSGGSGTASYQWYLVNGNTYTTILGATSPSYTPPAFNLAGNYAYSVGMTQTLAGCGTGFSAVANVSVVADPTVSTPTGASYCQGGAASAPLTVIATGGINAGYTYQWYSNGSNNNTTGIPISGANAASYTPPTSTIGNLYYYCLVNQGSGCQASSAPAAIQVGPGPAFTTQPIASQTVCAGATLNTLSVAYSGGVGTPAYQWYSSSTNNNFGGTPIAGESNASFTPNPNVVGLNYYYCVVSFAALTTCSSITSNVAQVNVISNPVFSSSPLASQTICQGSVAQTLSFATSGGSGTASYQWYNVNGSNYTPILGATGLTYTPPTNLPVGTYNYAVAMNQVASGCSTGFSSNSELVVLAQPVVSTPVGGVYCQGGIGQALSVSVSGGLGSSTYQWYQHTINSNNGGTVIPQATASTYTPSLSSLGTLYYYCVVTQNAGCASSSAVATVVSNPSPVISTQPIANQTICTGGTPSALTVSYTGGVGAASYQWYSNTQNSNVGGTPITGATFSTYIPSNFTTVGSSFYYCVVSLSNSSCPIVTSNVAAVNAVANPTVNGPLSATYCQSTSVAQPLSVVANGGTSNNYNYQWYSNASNANFGGNPILGANNANYTPNINGSSTYYYCVVSQAGGCQTASTPAAVTIVSAPTVSSQALSPQSVCIGGTPQALTIATTGGVSAPSYQWYSNNVNSIVNATAIANANTQSFTPNSASTSGTLYYFCQVTYPANSACPTLVSNAAIVNAVADPVVSSPNSASYCQNTTSVAPLSVTASGGISTSYTYQWYSNTANSTIGGTPIAGANTNTYVPLVNQIGTLYYYCEVTQGSGCEAFSGLSTISVGVAAAINQQPIPAQSLCLGQTPSPLTVAVSAGNYALTYQWYSNVNNSTSGGTLIVGATSASYLPPSNVLGTKYYYCIVTIAGGGCGNLTSNTASISVVTTPSMFQPNSQSICCQASSAPVNFVGTATSYSWTANSSSPLLTGFSSAGNGDIPANVLTNNSTTPQNIVYLVTPSNQGCNGTPVQFNISVMPCLSVSVPSDQYYCAGESVPAYVFSGVGQTYSWVNTNTSIGLQNAGINFVQNFVAQNTTSTTQVATITVTPNFMGCAGAAQSYSISIYPLPLVDAGLDQEVCSGGSVTLNASGAPNLIWDNGVVNGQTFIPNATTTYTVTGTDGNGCQNSDVVVVTVNNPTSATLNVTACDAYTLNGQTYTASGTYSQLLSNSAGCDSTLTLNLTLNYSPNQPNIYVQNQVNLSTDLVPGLTYQWIQCSDLAPIPGQTAITYNPTSNGVYAVVVTNGCGSDTSLCTSITTIGLDEHLSSQILLYPNPNNGVFTLEMPQALIGQTIQIFDMAGRLIQENTAQELKQHIELNDVATGSYWLRIGTETPMKLVKN